MIESTTERPYKGDAKCRCGKPAVVEINIPPHPPWYRCAECEKRFKQETRWESTGENFRKKNIICPYCGDVIVDSWEIESDCEEYECRECGRRFDIEVEHTVTYSTKRSICEMPVDWNGDDEE